MPLSDNTTKTPRFFVLASICLVVTALYYGQDLFIPLALGILFTFLLSPLVIRLERLSMPRVAATVVVVLLALGLLVLLTWTVSNQALNLADSLPNIEPQIARKLSHIPFLRSSRMETLQKTVKELSQSVETPTSQPTTAPAAASQPAKTGKTDSLAQSIAQTFADALRSGPPVPVIVQEQTPAGLGMLRSLLSTAAAPLGTAFIVIVFVIFMLLRREDLRDRLIRLVGEGQLDVTTQALSDAGDRISRYLLMQSMINTAYGVAIGTGLWVIGKVSGQEFPNAALWGLLCGLLRFVPYVGPWLGGSCPVLLSFAVFPGVTPFICTVCLFVGIELINNSVLEPVMYGSSTGLSAIAILAAAVFWTWLWGPIGLLLSTPLTVCAVVIGKHVPSLQFLDVLLGDEPVLPPPTRLYQRLLALDTEEASDVLKEYQKEMPLEELYDSVVLPALSMAEWDFHRGKLDDRRHEAVRESLRDLIDEAGEREEAAAIEQAARGSKKKDEPDEPAPYSLPQDCTLNVLLLPAKDEADEVVCMMLAQLLALRGYSVTTISNDSLANEMVAEVERKSADLLVVSALPPDAVAHARYLTKKLHAQYPELPAVVGVWTMEGDLKRARERIATTAAARLVGTLRKALDEIHQLAQPRIAHATSEANSTPAVTPT